MAPLTCQRIEKLVSQVWSASQPSTPAADSSPAGYVVAAVEFPRTNCHVAHPDEGDLVNQPADVASVIRRLLAVSTRSHDVLTGLVNPVKIAVAGHSDGGDTVAALAGNTCCLDRRVKAAIVLAGAEWPPLPGAYFAAAAPPILFVQGTADTWNPPAAMAIWGKNDAPRFRRCSRIVS